jgi:hypothetical protein
MAVAAPPARIGKFAGPRPAAKPRKVQRAGRPAAKPRTVAAEPAPIGLINRTR